MPSIKLPRNSRQQTCVGRRGSTRRRAMRGRNYAAPTLFVVCEHRQLRDENGRLKRRVADPTLDRHLASRQTVSDHIDASRPRSMDNELCPVQGPPVDGVDAPRECDPVLLSVGARAIEFLNRLPCGERPNLHAFLTSGSVPAALLAARGDCNYHRQHGFRRRQTPSELNERGQRASSEVPDRHLRVFQGTY